MRLAGKGDISSAIGILRELVEASDDPEDRLLLGKLAYLATDYAESQVQLERAYRDFQSRGLPRRAAMVATALGRLHFDGLEDQVVARGWFARALGLLEHEEPCVEKGYALLGMFAPFVANSEELDVNARLALELAQRFQDRNLECKALGDSGLALVSMGRIRDGMARLDEAFTMIIGDDCTDPAVISQVGCNLLTACDRCGDVIRAESWLRFIEKSAPSSHQGPTIHTFAHCWSAFGSVLCQVGRWNEAETALRMGLVRGEATFHYVRLTTRAALADLWIRQRRVDEAARLIDQSIDRIELMGPRARLYLAQGRYGLAAAVARQGLRQLSGDCLRAASMLLVLVEAELGGGNAQAAEEAAVRLRQLTESSDAPAIAGQAALALGKTAAARGDMKLAARHFDAGLAGLGDDRWPLLRAPLHLELARANMSNAPAEAIVNGQAALSIYQRLGAPEASVAADLLWAQGVPVTVAPAPPTALDVLSRRERDVLALLAQGMSNSAIARRLFITAKTAEHHVSSILGKLGLRNRTEAAAFAASFRLTEEQRDQQAPTPAR